MGPFLESEIKREADDRYCKLDRHAPDDDVLPLLVGKGFEIRVIEGMFRGRDEFKRLCEGWIHHYFDERRKLRELHFTPV